MVLLALKNKVKSNDLHAAFGGGVGSFGANFAVFHYKNTTVWIDVGAGFENASCPGIQKTLPNLELASTFLPDIVILTHAHEDHIGAFPFFSHLISKKALVITSEFTLSVLRERLLENQMNIQDLNFRIIKKNTVYETGDFIFSFFFMPHSIPQVFSVGFHVKSLNKKIYFTSDFKTKGVEPRYKPEEIQKYAPVDFLFCDSTGSIARGFSSQEDDIAKNLEKVIESSEGRLFITTFSSHIERLRTIFRLSDKYGRKVGLLGRSLYFYLGVAFHAKEFPVRIKDLNQPSNQDSKAIWIVSGCQADKHSTLNRLSKDELHSIHLRAKDTFLYSSSIIPGSEESVYSALNRIAQKKVNVIGLNKGEISFHTSGHGKQQDILKLVSWLKPKTIIPVHGDHLHFINFYEFIKDIDIQILDSNHVYTLNSTISNKFALRDRKFFVEGVGVHEDQKMLETRKNMGSEGICNVILKKNSFELLTIDYLGVISNRFYEDNKDKFYQEVYEIARKVAANSSLKKEKKLKEKIYKYNETKFRKKPCVNIITV